MEVLLAFLDFQHLQLEGVQEEMDIDLVLMDLFQHLHQDNLEDLEVVVDITQENLKVIL